MIFSTIAETKSHKPQKQKAENNVIKQVTNNLAAYQVGIEALIK